MLKNGKRSRMTAQSKANIVAAKEAILLPERTRSGLKYKVELLGERGSAFVENAAGPIKYSSMASARNAVTKHNNALNPVLAPTI